MEATRPILQAVPDDGGFPWPDENGEILSLSDAIHRVRDLLDENAGLVKLTKKQAKENGALSRRIQEDEDPRSHPRGAEIVALVERWKQGAGHPNSKVSGDRIKLVKSRLKDDYTIEQLELAVDGICSHPYVTNGHRTTAGHDSNRHDRLGIALGGGEKVEEFARLGYAARKAGWTVGDGWPA
jgi:hypothetical protein